MSDVAEEIIDINTWLVNPQLKWNCMSDHSLAQALEYMLDISREGWMIAVVERERTLLVRQSYPGSEESVGLLFSQLCTEHAEATANALGQICTPADTTLIQNWLQSYPDGVVVADLDKDRPRMYALS